MAWVAVGAAAVSTVGGALMSSALGPSGGGSVASGAANIAGGMLSASDAQTFAQQVATTANPFGQYNSQFGTQLANATTAGTYGNANPSAVSGMSSYTNGTTLPLTSALNGSSIGNQLNNLVSNPSSIYSTPQYTSAFNQGQSAVNSTLAAQGLNQSGNQLAALQNYGMSFGSNYYNQQLSQLSGLYGQSLTANQQGYSQLSNNASTGLAANNQAFNQLALLSGASNGSPTAAAQAMSTIYGNVNSAGQSIGTGIGQVATGAGNLLNGLSTGSGTTGFTTGLGTTTTNNISGSGALYGTSSGIDTTGYTYSGGNSWGFTA